MNKRKFTIFTAVSALTAKTNLELCGYFTRATSIPTESPTNIKTLATLHKFAAIN